MYLFRHILAMFALILIGIGGAATCAAADQLTVGITFTVQNTTTTVDLNGPGAGTGYSSIFTEDGPAVSIVDSGALSLSDPDQITTAGAIITITNLLDGGAELIDVTTAGGVTKSYNAGTGVLTLSGSASLAVYQSVLRTLVYSNSSNFPSTTTRTISVVVNDGLALSVPAIALVDLIPQPDAPVVDLNGAPGGVDYSTNFQEGGGAVIIVNETGMTVSDVDSAIITTATVTLTNLLDGVSESLAVTDSGGITSSYNSGTGVLTLTGSVAPSVYQTVLRTLRYNNISSNPNTTARVVTVTATDGGLTSAVATTTINVFATNSTPTIDAIADQILLEDSGVTTVPLSGITNGGDAPGQIISITATSSNTALLLNPTVVYTSDNPTGSLLISPNANQFGSTTITVRVSDNGGTALGSIDFTTRIFTVTVTPVNDRPTLDVISNITINENDPTQVIPLTGISVGPVNESGQSLSIIAVSSRTDIIPTPTISYASPQSSGSLSFTPIANASGPVTIIVWVSDNGGVANGGQYTFTRSFTVDVQPIVHTPVIVTNAGLTVQVGSSAAVSYLNLEVSDNLSPDQLTYTIVNAPTRGDLERSGVLLNATDTFTQADINAGLMVYTHTGAGLTADGFSFTVMNSEGNTIAETPFVITIIGALPGTIPVVNLPSGAVTWIQGGGPILLDTGATVTDSGGNMGPGNMTVSMIAGSTVNDILSVRHVGNGAGQIGVVGAVVSYEGVQIGTLSGGSGGSALSISLSDPAMPAAVEALLRNVTFNNSALAPTSTPRRAQVLVTNRTGGVSSPVTKDIVMIAVNQAPVVTLPARSVSYPEASGAMVLDATATYIDVDSPNLAGGSLTATWTSNGTTNDQLWIRNEGAGANQISVTGNAVSYNGGIIGFLSGGLNGGPFTVTLTSLATPTSTQALLRNMTFTNASLLPSLALRQLSVVANDGNGGVSSTAVLSVVIQGTEDPPVLTLPSPPTIYVQGAGAIAVDPAATVSDPDSVVFNTGVLAIEFISGATANDRLAINPNGSNPGEIDIVGTDVRYGGTVIGTVTGPGTMANPLLVVLNNQATIAATQALLRRVAFRNDAVPPVVGARTIRVTLTDGTGLTSLPVSTVITVQAVNSPPVVTLPGAGVNWSEGAPPADVTPTGTLTDVDSSTFPGGSLTISVTDALGGEVLSVRNDGIGAGQIGVSASDITYGGVIMGTMSGGNGSPLVFSLNGTATPVASQALLRAVQFARTGQLLSATTRTIQVVANDGLDASSAVTTIVNLIPVDDPPQATATMLVTVMDIPAEGQLVGNDPEGEPVTWEIVTPPVGGTLTFVDAAVGRVHYIPVLGTLGDVTFTARLSDGVTWSAPVVMTIRITDRLAAVRPLVISAPPREGFLGTALTYQVTTELGALPLGTDLNFHVVGVPAGATVVVTKTTVTTATVTWTATGTPQQHQQIGLIISDPVSGTSSYQPIQILWQAPLGGAG